MHFLLAIAALTAGTIAWFTVSHWIAAFMTSVEDRYPELTGSKRWRGVEVAMCGAAFIACLALSIWIMRMFWAR